MTNESDYWQEAVRLAELRMSELIRVQIGYERRAVLLITFCVVVVGYLLSGDWQSLPFIIAKVLTCIYLCAAVAKSLRTFEFSESGVQGVHPRTTANPSLFGGEADVLQKYMHRTYSERIDRNQNKLDDRIAKLKSAKLYFYAGLWLTVAIALWEKAAPFLQKMRATASPML